MKFLLVFALFLLPSMPGSAHQLDEYLQGTIVTLEKNRLEAHMTLTPGVAVLPLVLAFIDVDADGAISEKEQRAYAASILHDLSLSLDGERLQPKLLSFTFPTRKELQEGLGEIHIGLTATLPPGGPDRDLIFENHHQTRISAYQINCLVPSDPVIRITNQNRNVVQSFYRLAYIQSDASPSLLSAFTYHFGAGWLAIPSLLLWRLASQLLPEPALARKERRS